MRHDTLLRVFRLFDLLRAERWTLDGLAAELHVTTRTVRRDIDALHRAGRLVRHAGASWWIE